MRSYQPLVRGAEFNEEWIKASLHELDLFAREVEKRVATQATGGNQPGGVVTSLSADSGIDLIGDVNLVSGTNIEVTQSGQDLSIVVIDLDLTYLRRDGGNSATGDIPMGSNKLTGLIAGTVSGDSIAHSLNSLNDLATANGNYSMGGNDLTNVDNITRFNVNSTIGTLASPFAIISGNFINADGIGVQGLGETLKIRTAVSLATPNGVTDLIFTESDNSIVVTTTDATNVWQTGTFAAKPIAIEGITSLDELAAAAADYSMGGFGFTNVDDIAGIASDTLEFISTDTDEATAEGFRINWDANVATPTSKAKFLTIGYTNDSDVYDEQVTLTWNAALGPCLTVEGSVGAFKGFMGFGSTFGARTGMLLLDNTIRMRIQDANAWDIGKDSLNLLGTVSFKFFNNAMVAGSAGPRFSFSPKVQATAGTLLAVLDVDGGTKKFKVEYDGAVIAYESRDVIRYALMMGS